MIASRLIMPVAVTCLLGVALTGCASTPSQNADARSPSPSASTTASPPASPVADCHDQFSATILNDPTGTPGVRYLELRNGADVACGLSGFPSVEYFTADHGSYGSMKKSDAYSRGTAGVEVAAGGSAYVWMHIVEAAAVHGDCGPTQDVSGLRITVPDSAKSIEASLDTKLCSGVPWYSEIQVGPFDSEQRAASKGY